MGYYFQNIIRQSINFKCLLDSKLILKFFRKNIAQNISIQLLCSPAVEIEILTRLRSEIKPNIWLRFILIEKIVKIHKFSSNMPLISDILIYSLTNLPRRIEGNGEKNNSFNRFFINNFTGP